MTSGSEVSGHIHFDGKLGITVKAPLDAMGTTSAIVSAELDQSTAVNRFGFGIEVNKKQPHQQTIAK